MHPRNTVLALLFAGAILLASVGLTPGLATAFVRHRDMPVPTTVSPEMQANIAREYPAEWETKPLSLAEFTREKEKRDKGSDEMILALAQRAHVSVEAGVLAGVRVYFVTPKEVLPENRDRVLIHVHGGGYVLNGGLIGAGEAIYMAHYGGIRCISVDYRLAPAHPYPAGLDDCMAVYKEVLARTPADKVGIFGTSSGGGMTLAMVLRAKKEGLLLPGALCAATPWSDLAKIGDTYFTNAGLDNMIVRYEGWIGDAAEAYAPNMDWKNPLLSPVYGDFTGFPPSLLVSGTRDLFLSNTVRVHEKMRAANVEADLLVHEGQSHAQYLQSFSAPETAFHFEELAKFFDRFLADSD